MGRGLLLLLAIVTGSACRHTAPTGPASGPAPLPQATAHAPPAAMDPCAGDCPALAEATLKKHPTKGLELLRACLQCSPRAPNDYARVADLQGEAGDSKAALQTLRAGTRAHPDAALLWQLRGRRALQANETQEGVQALTRARGFRPDDVLIQTELNAALKRHGGDEAKAQVEVSAYIEEAVAAFSREDYAGAEDALSAAVRHTEGAPLTRADLRQRLALVYIAQGNLPKAREAVEAALMDAPTPGDLRATLLVTHSDVLIALGDPGSALISAASAAEISPGNALAHANVALCRAIRKEWPKAVASLRSAIDRGLPEYLTRAELLGLDGFQRMKTRDDFMALVDEGWPAK